MLRSSGLRIFSQALRGQRLRVWDLSLAKNWKIKEQLTAQFRIECFNVINAVNYSIPAPAAGTNPASPSSFGFSREYRTS
jgi:hypothetical protein